MTNATQSNASSVTFSSEVIQYTQDGSADVEIIVHFKDGESETFRTVVSDYADWLDQEVQDEYLIKAVARPAGALEARIKAVSLEHKALVAGYANLIALVPEPPKPTITIEDILTW